MKLYSFKINKICICCYSPLFSLRMEIDLSIYPSSEEINSQLLVFQLEKETKKSNRTEKKEGNQSLVDRNTVAIKPSTILITTTTLGKKSRRRRRKTTNRKPMRSQRIQRRRTRTRRKKKERWLAAISRMPILK